MPRPFGNSPHVRRGWEMHTRAYPEYGSGGALQYLGKTRGFDDAWVYDLADDYGKAKPAAEAAPAADLGLSGRGYRPQPGERSMPREQWQLEQSEARARNSVAGTDQPLENPHPNAATRGHGHEYHGYQTTDAQQAERVRTGTTPDGASGRPPASASRYGSARAEAEALGRGRRKLDQRLANGQTLSYPDPVTGQPTYVSPANGFPVRDPFSVPTNRSEGYGNGQIRRQDPATNQPLRDANGDYVPVADPAPRPNALISWSTFPAPGSGTP